MKIFVFDIFEKGQILRPFSLRFRKKRGPERVNGSATLEGRGERAGERILF